MGLDHSSEAVRRELLQWGMPVQLPPEVPSYALSPLSRAARQWGTLLRSKANEQHLHVVLRQRSKHHLWHHPRNGRRELWLFIATVFCLLQV